MFFRRRECRHDDDECLHKNRAFFFSRKVPEIISQKITSNLVFFTLTRAFGLTIKLFFFNFYQLFNLYLAPAFYLAPLFCSVPSLVHHLCHTTRFEPWSVLCSKLLRFRQAKNI